MTDNEKYFGKRNIFVTGRAATGLWLILKKENIKNKNVLFPANICYAPIFASIYAGNKPVFADISDWANVSFETLKDKIDNNVACVVLPHMYGKVVNDIKKIAFYCKEKNIMLVEDCASAFGASYDGKTVGSFGDYSIFSFDYSKIVDVGFGGIIASNNDLSDLSTYEKPLPTYDGDIEDSLGTFSKVYRIIRNAGNNSFVDGFYKKLPEYMKKYFLFKLSTEQKNEVLEALTKVDFERERRWNLYRLYEEKFSENHNIKICNYSKGDIPWRFSFLYEGERKDFVSYLLKKNIHISDWYPFIGTMFGFDKKNYVNTDRIEKTIYNLPLEDIEIIENNVYNVNKYLYRN